MPPKKQEDKEQEAFSLVIDHDKNPTSEEVCHMVIADAFTTIFLDRESVPQASLNIENRTRTNLLPWAGQFSPQLVEELLTAHGEGAETVADPFAGSGTSLIEAARLGKVALGSDRKSGCP